MLRGTTENALSIGSTAATSIASMIAAHTAAAGAAGAAAAGGSAAGAAAGSAWVPIIGPAIAGVTLAIGLWLNRKGPKQKIASTAIVNDLEPLLKQNVSAYLEGPRTKSSQAQALKNFDDAWAWLTSQAGCGNPELGNPGKACIEDRARGGKWDWFSYYRDPIAADQAKEDSFLDVLGLSQETNSGGGGLLLAGGLLLLGVML